MSYDNDEEEDNEIEEIQKRKLTELQRRLVEEQRRAQAEAELRTRKRLLLGRILTQEARERLERLRMVKSELVEQLEIQLIEAAQTGRAQLPINDEQLKAILTRIQSSQRGIRIRRI